MRALLHSMASKGCSKLAVVMHLGAGAGRELEALDRFDPARVMMVEANPDFAQRLVSMTHGRRRVRVVASAVAPQAGSSTLRVLNNPRESSLLEPARLLAQMPNLRVARQLEVSCVTLRSLLEQAALPPNGENLLLVELQGAELSVLSSVSAKTLQQFSWIAVRSSEEPLYEGGASLADVDKLLCAASFRAVARVQGETVWPYREVLYQRDLRAMQLKELGDRLQAQEQTISALREREQRLVALERERADLLRELEQARQGVELSTKLQVLREADLRDLQERYRQALAVQEKQRALAAQLGERLRSAAGYFRQLEQQKGPPLLPGAGALRRRKGAAGRKRR